LSGVSLIALLAFLALGGVFCYLAGIFIVEGLRRINPAWVGAVPPPLPPAPKKKTKLIPRRKIPAHLLKLAAKAGAAGFLIFSPMNALTDDSRQMDGIRTELWPVWARPGNDNVISRIKYFGESHASIIDSVPEEMWPFWIRQGNEHLLKRRIMCCGSTV